MLKGKIQNGNIETRRTKLAAELAKKTIIVKGTKQKEAIVVGRNFDFWLNEGDSIYDKLYGDDL